MTERYDAVIIGGGPAGSTTAIRLAQAGWSVAILERATFPRNKVCGEFLSAANLPLLRALGVCEAFLDAAGSEVRRIGLFSRHGSVTAKMPCLRTEPGGWGRALGREHLDTLLLQQAQRAGARVFQPWNVRAMLSDSSGVQAVCGNGGQEATLMAPVIVSAHGSWEPGPLPSQPARRPPRPSDLFGFKTHLSNCRLPTGFMPLIGFPGGYGGMVHTDQGRVSLSCCIRRDQLDACRRRDRSLTAGDAVLRHITSTCAPAREVLEHAALESEWRSAGPIRPGIRTTYQQGIFLVGNAAGEAHPVIAEGISMAMQSGYLLARSLVTAESLGAAREAYAREWRRTFAWRIHVAAVVAQWARHPAAVSLVRPLLSAFPAMLTEGARTSGKVNVICSPSF